MLSLKATLLWTWSIPWLDRDGMIEVESDFLKTNVLPRRKDISEDEIKELVTEIVTAGLWITFKDENGYLIAKEKTFKEHQGIEYKREVKSKWEGKDLIPTNISRKSDGNQTDLRPEGKVVEGKVVEVSSDQKKQLPVDNPEKQAPIKDQKEHLKKLCKILESTFKNFNPYQFIQKAINLKIHPEPIIKTLSRMIEDKAEIISPWPWAEHVLKVESQNFNERDFQNSTEKDKSIYDELLSDIKELHAKKQTHQKNP